MSNQPTIRRVNREDYNLLQAVFKRTLAMYQPDVPVTELTPGTHLNAWDWGPGIALYGLQKSYHLLDPATQEDYLNFWRMWFEQNLDKSEPSSTLNGALLLNVLWQSSYDPGLRLVMWESEGYRAHCRKRAEFYLKNAARLPSGVFGHSVSGIPESGLQVWADNLFMLVLFLTNYARDLGRTRLFAQMVEQVRLHFQHLTDPATGMLYHGWQFDPNGPVTDRGGYRGTHLNGALWGRGNGWAAMAVAEMVELCQEEQFEPFRHELIRLATPNLQALLACQRPDGFWNTLLDRPDSYPETSATASIAYAFSKLARLGTVGPEFAEAARKSFAALRSQIAPDGVVKNVSGSTPILVELEAYNRVPHDSIATWGQGMALLALSEANRQ